MTHTTSLSWICCFWNENTSLAFPSRHLVIITKHLSTRWPSFPESLELITPGNALLSLQALRNVGFWAPLLQSQTLLWLVEGREKMQPNLKRQTAGIIHRDALASPYIINNNNKTSRLFHLPPLPYSSQLRHVRPLQWGIIFPSLQVRSPMSHGKSEPDLRVTSSYCRSSKDRKKPRQLCFFIRTFDPAEGAFAKCAAHRAALSNPSFVPRGQPRCWITIACL